MFRLSTVKWNVFSLSNKNLAISTLCLVGLKPEDLNFLYISKGSFDNLASNLLLLKKESAEEKEA